MNKGIEFGLVAAFVVGCATTPTPTDAAKPVPATRVLSSSLLAPRPGAVAITIKRDSGFTGSACNVRVFVDGQAIADLDMAEKVVMHLDPGQHMLGVRPSCGGPLLAEQHLNTQTGPRTFRTGYGGAGEFFLQPTAF